MYEWNGGDKKSCYVFGIVIKYGYMMRYTTKTADTCWPDCLACMLSIPPARVPNFVKLYKHDYMNYSRKWLEENFKKGLVYIPAAAFMETSRLRTNGPIGPAGFSIAYLAMAVPTASHVVIAFNGGLVWDNGDSREAEYGHIAGYYVLYDLNAPKAKWANTLVINKKKIRKKK